MTNEKLNELKKTGTIIYGCSDDLIEFDGEFSEECGHYCNNENDSALLVMSDGTILEVKYDDLGIWRFHVIHAGCLFENIEHCTNGEDEVYSDVVIFKHGIKFAYKASEYELVK